jgi:hypothetical protein
MSARRCFGLLLGFGCGVLALAECARPAVSVSDPGIVTPGISTSRAPATPVQIKVNLPQRQVHAGQSIQGTAVITNNTGRPISVPGCPGSWLQVGLTNGKIQFSPAVPDIACAPSIQLAPGPNTFPVTVSTTYQACLGPQGRSMLPMPSCDNGKPPPLPVGTYRIATVAAGLTALDPPPLTVTLVP